MELGLEVPTLREVDQEAIRQGLSPSVKTIASCTNPVDLTGSAVDQDILSTAITMSQLKDIDCLIILILPYAPGMSQDLGALLGSVPRKSNIPVIAYLPRLDKYRILIEGFEINNVPVAHSIEGAIHMAEALMKYSGGDRLSFKTIPQ